MIPCDQCGKPINPAKDDFASLRIMMGLNNDQSTYYYLHEECIDDFQHSDAGGKK